MKRYFDLYHKYIYPLSAFFIITMFVLMVFTVHGQDLPRSDINKIEQADRTQTKTLEIIITIMGGLMLFVLGNSEYQKRLQRKEKNDLIKATIDKANTLSDALLHLTDNVTNLTKLWETAFPTIAGLEEFKNKISALHPVNHPGQTL